MVPEQLMAEGGTKSTQRGENSAQCDSASRSTLHFGFVPSTVSKIDILYCCIKWWRNSNMLGRFFIVVCKNTYFHL